jgi:Domain of unknown function (DUF4253)
VAAGLPDEGPVRIGPVDLPAGRLITGYGDHVAWATADPVPGSGRVWAALSTLHPQTGLVPIQLDDGGFIEAEDPREADRVDVGALLENLWRGSVWAHVDDPEAMRQWTPFTLEWPGLAAPQRSSLTPEERQRALDVVLPQKRVAHGLTPEARIGLIAAERPADVLAVIGWGGLVNRDESVLPLTAVLRSWENRFGARLIDVGDADLRLLVDRPPRTLQQAQHIAAEQVVLADECIDAARDVPDIAARLVNAPIWTFCWD